MSNFIIQSTINFFIIAALGYLIGSIKINGVQLGAAAVLIVALIFGHFNFEVPVIVRDMGLSSFVTAVGFIAGPYFFRNFKKKAVSFVLVGCTIILIGTGLCVLIIKVCDIPIPLGVGMLSGALTSTPGLAAAIEATGDDMASVGYGIAYPFGVLGVVLFVQLTPKFLKINIAEDVSRMRSANVGKSTVRNKNQLVVLDEHGIFAFCTAIVLGLLIGKISIPLPGGNGAYFALGSSGGPLFAGLVMGHYGSFGKFSVSVPNGTLNVMREVGLVLFLIGTGTGAGKGFVEILQSYGTKLFVLGSFMTLIPMIAGYFLAQKIFFIDPLTSLGAICGGMTSTPALGALISMTKSELVATAYAATYPAALIMVVLACEFIPILF